MTKVQAAFITGVSSGIGYATTLEFIRQGINVAGTARRLDRLHQLTDAIAKLPGVHGEFLPIVGNVRDAESVHAAVQQTFDHFGRIDILVANAGVGQRGSLVDSDWNDIETVLRTNIDGVLHSIRAVVPLMQLGDGGHIFIVSSVVYNMVSPFAATYAASKAAVTSIANSVRLELEPERIRVTTLLVGRTETEFNEKRLGKAGRSSGGVPVMFAEDVAKTIYKALRHNRKIITLRWFDRLLVFANMLVPGFVGRMAMRQYK